MVVIHEAIESLCHQKVFVTPEIWLKERIGISGKMQKKK